MHARLSERLFRDISYFFVVVVGRVRHGDGCGWLRRFRAELYVRWGRLMPVDVARGCES